MTGKSSDVVIAGGGVIGLSVAYVLAREGLRATVLDAGPLGRAASWAGAGIVAPGAARPTDHPDAPLRTLGARLHEEWSLALREETGLDNGYRRCGGLDVAWTSDEAEWLRETAPLWDEEGIAFRRLGPAEFAEVEPALSPLAKVAYFFPDRAQIRNPWHLRALEAACERRGVVLRPQCPALGFDVASGRVRAVRTPEGPLPCDCLIVAAGPWSESLLSGLVPDVATPPIRGQIVLLRTPSPVLRRIVEHGHDYLVPRDDGRVLVGSTEEHAGFEARTTPRAVRDLIDTALRLCPALESAEVERAWAGLRPGSHDGRPYIGPAPGLENAIVATGHRRAGLQLSPGTAEVVADLILGRPPRIDLSPYRIGREPSPVEAVFRS
jgi:glycine oxidase